MRWHPQEKADEGLNGPQQRLLDEMEDHWRVWSTKTDLSSMKAGTESEYQ